MPIARAARRHGLRTALVALFAARAVAFLLLACVTSLAGALLAAAVTGLMSRGTAPLIESALIAQDDTAAAVKSLARLRMVRNAGLAAGGLPAGLVVWLNDPSAYRIVIAASALLFLLAAAICRSLPDQALTPGRASPPLTGVTANTPFLLLTTLYGALTLSAILLGVGLPLWIVERSTAPTWIIGSIQLLNTVLVVTLQGWASRGTDALGRALVQLRRGGWLAAVSTGAVMLGGSGGAVGDVAVVLAVVIGLTFAEVLIVSGGEGAVLLHIPGGERPTYLAAFNLGFGCATVIGPPLVAMTAAGPTLAWLGWSALFALLALLVRCLPAPRSELILPIEAVSNA
jgi:hypothetical protein